MSKKTLAHILYAVTTLGRKKPALLEPWQVLLGPHSQGLHRHQIHSRWAPNCWHLGQVHRQTLQCQQGNVHPGLLMSQKDQSGCFCKIFWYLNSIKESTSIGPAGPRGSWLDTSGGQCRAGKENVCKCLQTSLLSPRISFVWDWFPCHVFYPTHGSSVKVNPRNCGWKADVRNPGILALVLASLLFALQQIGCNHLTPQVSRRGGGYPTQMTWYADLRE